MELEGAGSILLNNAADPQPAAEATGTRPELVVVLVALRAPPPRTREKAPLRPAPDGWETAASAWDDWHRPQTEQAPHRARPPSGATVPMSGVELLRHVVQVVGGAVAVERIGEPVADADTIQRPRAIPRRNRSVCARVGLSGRTSATTPGRAGPTRPCGGHCAHLASGVAARRHCCAKRASGKQQAPPTLLDAKGAVDSLGACAAARSMQAPGAGRHLPQWLEDTTNSIAVCARHERARGLKGIKKATADRGFPVSSGPACRPAHLQALFSGTALPRWSPSAP